MRRKFRSATALPAVRATFGRSSHLNIIGVDHTGGKATFERALTRCGARPNVRHAIEKRHSPNVPHGTEANHGANGRTIRWLCKLRASFVAVFEVVLVALFAALCVDVLWGVFSRYVIGEQSRFTEELAVYLLVWVSLLGAGITYGDKGHLGLDYLVCKFEPAAQRVAAIAVELLVGLFAVVALVYGGTVLVTSTLQAEQVSPALGVPVGYVYLAVPISGVIFCVFCIEHLARLLTRRVLRPQP